MKFDWLKALVGDAYTDEIDEKVAQQIGKDFVARKDFNELNEEKKALGTTITERDAQLEELKKVDPAALQAKITELQTANETAKADFAQQMNQLKLDTAVETRLIKEGAVSTKAVTALLDTGKLGLDGDSVTGLDDQLAALRQSEAWAFKAQVPPASGTRQGASGTAEPAAELAQEITDTLFGKSE